MQVTITIPATEEQIAAETTRLRAEVKLRQESIQLQQAEINVLYTALRHYQSVCKHAARESNDGSRNTLCPFCGYSYY